MFKNLRHALYYKWYKENPKLKMKQYQGLVEDLPKPTKTQIENFTLYVATVHSWYKHLPYYLPGVRFYFFLDPHAGSMRSIDENNKIRYVDPKDFGLMSIEQYRTNYGYLSFFCAAGRMQIRFNGSAMLYPRTGAPLIADRECRHYHLPTELEEIGSVPLTAVIHPNSFSPIFGWIGCGNQEDWIWPEESGGIRVIEKLLEYIKSRKYTEYESFIEEADIRNIALYSYGNWIVDPVIKELLMPEHERQLKEIRQAILRVCDRI